jgi:methyl-accepting chemotaxis protein
MVIRAALRMDPMKTAKPAGRDTCPAIFGHGITWLILIFILGISAWASSLYLMPLVDKAHTIADDANILLGKANDKFSLVDLIEEQVNDIDKLIPSIQTTVTNIDSTAQNIDSNMDEFMPRLDSTVQGIDAEVRNVQGIANRTSALVDSAALALASILDTTTQAKATLVEVHAQARALDAMLREANQTLQEIRAAQRALSGSV